jgi:hypothetical protein
MITIASSGFRLTQRPAISAVTSGSGFANFNLSSSLEGIGTVVLHGAAGDSAAGWQVGFFQAQWIETNWGEYRGLSKTDGSVFVQRARPPARPRQACFDCIQVGGRFYGTGSSSATSTPATGGAALPFVDTLAAGSVLPLTVQVLHRDTPADSFPLSRLNTKTRQQNFLHAAQLEFAFCMSLVVREPAGRLHFLQNLYWNVNWQSTFRFASATAAPTITPVAAGTSANVGRLIPGRPTDKRFLTVLTTAQTTNCNAVFRAATAATAPPATLPATPLTNPNIRETTAWQNFDVTR